MITQPHTSSHLSFACLLLTLCIGCGNPDTETENAATSAPSGANATDNPTGDIPPVDFVLTAADFVNEFKTNEPAANEKFLGKRIELTGKLQMFDHSYSGGSYIWLGGTKWAAEPEEPWAFALPGQTIKVTGTFEPGMEFKIIDAIDERLVVNASDLAKQFNDNKDATNTKYAEKWLEIRGLVASKDIDESGGGSITLQGDGDTTIQCAMVSMYLKETFPASLQNMKEGDMVRIAAQYSKPSSLGPELILGRFITAPIPQDESTGEQAETSPPR